MDNRIRLLIYEKLDRLVQRGTLTQEQADRVMDVVNRAGEYPTQREFLAALDGALWPDGKRSAWAEELLRRWDQALLGDVNAAG